MSAKVKPLHPPATEAELEFASVVWTAAQDIMVRRGFGRHLFGNQSRASNEFVVLMLRECAKHQPVNPPEKPTTPEPAHVNPPTH
jgi:hypothetical protein